MALSDARLSDLALILTVCRLLGARGKDCGRVPTPLQKTPSRFQRRDARLIGLQSLQRARTDAPLWARCGSDYLFAPSL